ncbi:T9SS type A sorting domain-containing protein [Hymenobacter sp. BT683]|uniref:T9SS type A sorting domain-containing protein n=1 Tax=Hymenobacter jeongseonensis TaxID=2791027 RepID=A0ABS0IFE9_9BACT|nr:T9SS type A sorting domain-containing protein [Hymenobacter jeongseonensis]MBF9236648.1 T9SS type A sorting domain-containing protein [Hymenobacter jeongseonensis]
MKLRAAFLLSQVLLVLLLAPVASVAQDRRPSRQAPSARLEIQAYQKARVQPVLRQQRLKLEAQLAPADRTQLAAYRAQLKTLREQGRALRKSAAPAGTRPTFTEAQLQLRQQLHAQTKTVMQGVAAMARKYQPTIKQLVQEVQPQQEQWAADMRAIAFKNATPEQQQKITAQASRKPHHSSSNRFFRPTDFLLMDVSAAAATEAGRAGVNFSFYPNPVTTTSQLDFNVKQSGPVTVDLLDGKGNTLRTLVAEPNAEQGPHSQQLNLRDLAAGTYFYKITTKSGSETKRFVKE